MASAESEDCMMETEPLVQADLEEEEEEIYEVINIHKMKSATPNLRVVNLYGINFVDDSHVEAFSSNCIQVLMHHALIMISSIDKYLIFQAGMFGRQLLRQSHWLFAPDSISALSQDALFLGPADWAFK